MKQIAWVIEFSTDEGWSWKFHEAYATRDVARNQMLEKGHWAWARIRTNRRVRIRKYVPAQEG